MIELLREFRVLGWDFDDTLVGHASSELFWRYIRTNPFDQTHYIITMRTHGWEKYVFNDLVEQGAELDDKHFIGVVNPPNQLWESHKLEMNAGTLTDDHPYHSFKAEQCVALGIDVLIDDMENGRLPSSHFSRHGVVHIHPDRLL
jgi:hypothetical protein